MEGLESGVLPGQYVCSYQGWDSSTITASTQEGNCAEQGKGCRAQIQDLVAGSMVWEGMSCQQ